MKSNKLNYQSPVLEATFLEMEQGIAAVSTTVSVGSGTDPYTPEVTDWTVGGFDNQNGDL
ncbi:hypothetical protein [Sphingobacterium hungaricum]|uniref:Uncharacterized protein n=1 Tax=Sphingobacterium hungaricum TaxID=2082723 RepID=A0A928UW84_9SPHI|nr:hypothetical protein [Sphingobacterium hungaricum]MBE8713842.1 hypothetical protein [Sphingobacterium hungaricum]